VGTMLQYQYSIEDDLITLTVQYEYPHNLPDGNAENIKEKWEIILTKLK
jgi:hypothetical protein